VKNIIKYSKYILMCLMTAIMFLCFTAALLFGIASISAISQATITELIVLVSFCYLFSLVGNSLLDAAGMLYKSVRS
jgi:hypothetical protein